jgi:serine/threonine protein kinase
MRLRFSGSALGTFVSADPNREAYLRIVEQRSPIGGRFTNVRRIDPIGGSGHFSLIFTALDSQTGKEAALKFYHPNKRHDAYRWACFNREAEVLESLSGQQDIIGFTAQQSEFVEDLPVMSGGTFQIQLAYYGMELAASDMGIITQKGIWDAERILVAFHVMCRAVQRIHARGISRRDLKPRNFLVSRSGAIRLSDFGTARHIDDPAERLSAVYGGPPGDMRYAAPELLACLHDDDPQIALKGDIFSLGATLFELFTGLVLVPLIFDEASMKDLMFLMNSTKRGQRSRIYDGFVSSMSNAHPLPDVSAMGAMVPQCIVERIDRLFKSMAAIDYRTRLCDFERIFLQVQSSLLILRNEEKFGRWREEKRRRRAAAAFKAQRLGVLK